MGRVYLAVSAYIVLCAKTVQGFHLPSETGKNHEVGADGTPFAANDAPGIDGIRRSVVASLLGVGFSTLGAREALAGEVGARITKAVTTSDFGISVRTSVVKGAQVMDSLDGQWEKFSDRFGLGSERSKQGERPKPKVIPDPLPLNTKFASEILSLSDRAFCSVSGIASSDLQSRIEKVANLVRVSFERSGISFGNDKLTFENADQFNFVVYAHFKAYSDLVIERNVEFRKFRSQFEGKLGNDLVTMVVPEDRLKKVLLGNDKGENLKQVLRIVDDLLSTWRQMGLVALADYPPVDEEKVVDWIDDVSDFEVSFALDGDITLDSQILLQEQGFRLYPNFCKYAIVYLMEQVSKDQKVSAMDYYFDTDYNSDPDRFEVKEVLLSVQLENP